MEKIKVEVTSKISTHSGTTHAVVLVSLGDNRLVAELSGWFLNYRIRKTVARFTETLLEITE